MGPRCRRTSPPGPAEVRAGLGARAWFGAQVGSSLWLLVAALRYLAEDAALGSALLALFLFTNAMGGCLWLLRAVRPVRPLFLAMLAAHGLATAGALLAIAAAGRLGPLREWGYGLRPWVWALAFPLAIVVLAVLWRGDLATSRAGRR